MLGEVLLSYGRVARELKELTGGEVLPVATSLRTPLRMGPGDTGAPAASTTADGDGDAAVPVAVGGGEAREEGGEAAELVARLGGVRDWYVRIGRRVRAGLAQRGAEGDGVLAEWQAWGESIEAVRTVADEALHGLTPIDDAEEAFREFSRTYGMVSTRLRDLSIGLDFLPTTAELTERAPRVKQLKGLAGSWFTWRFRMALTGLSRVGDPYVPGLVDDWNTLVAAYNRNPNPSTATLDWVNDFVNRARSRVSAVPDAGSDAGSDGVSDVSAVVRAWLAEAEDGWAQSAEFFAANSTILRRPGAAVALRRMVEAEPDSSRLRVHAALLQLAAVDRVDDGFDYLTRIGRTDRRRLLLEQARIGGDAATYAAFGTLVDGVDIRFAQEVSEAERAYAEVMGAIGLVLDGDIVGAVTLAAQKRRFLTSSPRVEWVVLLNGLAGELPTFALGLKSVQSTIVTC
jgi:hypothetical protein